ncbi:12040_t:CDS:2, partial [Dentiscutata erythropus]
SANMLAYFLENSEELQEVQLFLQEVILSFCYSQRYQFGQTFVNWLARGRNYVSEILYNENIDSKFLILVN